MQRLARVSAHLGREVWVKRDDLTHPRYGGNKVRKLTHLFEDAARRGATDVLTVGAMGSHHVLATAVHGKALGLTIHAALWPRPGSPHVEETVRATLGQGAHLYPTGGLFKAFARVGLLYAQLRLKGRRPYQVPAGGSSALAAVGYAEAVFELQAQVEAGELPRWPDTMVCAVGTAGTYAGLLAGVIAANAPTQVVGVRVADAWSLVRPTVPGMVNGALHRLAKTRPSLKNVRAPRLAELQVLEGEFGEGYGVATEAGARATALFGEDGVTLEPTYTAKAAAGLIAAAKTSPREARYLFWNTFSSAPLVPLLDPSAPPLSEALAALFL